MILKKERATLAARSQPFQSAKLSLVSCSPAVLIYVSNGLPKLQTRTDTVRWTLPKASNRDFAEVVREKSGLENNPL